MSTEVVSRVLDAPPPEAPPTTYEEAEAAWLAERRTFIGGSEIHELLNIPHYGKGCVRALAYRKSGAAPDYPEQMDDTLLRRGKILEPLVAAMYEEETKRKVRRPAMDEFGFAKVQRHPDYPWAGVHTDRLILAGFGGVKETGDLEIKTHGEGPYWNIVRNGIFPAQTLQVQHSLFVTGHPWGSYAALGIFAGLPLKTFDLDRDDGVIDEIKRAGDAFWTLREKGQLPEPLPNPEDDRCRICAFRLTCRGEELDHAQAAFVRAERSSKQKLVQINDPELLQDLEARQVIKQEIKALTNPLDPENPGALELLEQRIAERLINRSIVPDSDTAVVNLAWKVSPYHWKGVVFDEKRLKAEKPEVYDEYRSPIASEKVSLRVYPWKGK